MQPAHIRGKGRVNKTKRLFHIELFGNNFIKEDIIYIELMNLSTTQNHTRENQPDNRLLNERTKALRVINAFLLSKTCSN